MGLTPGVNRAIAEASRSRGITSATLMANSRSFEEAVALARAVPGLKIGCHIVLVDGEPLNREVSTLTEGGSRFRTSLKKFAVAALRKELSQQEIQHEAEAQISKIQAAGITLTHVDTHKHTHMFPHVLEPVLAAAKARGIRAIRNPFEPFKVWPKTTIAAKPAMWGRAAEVALLRQFSTNFKERVREQGMVTTDGTVGIIATGCLDQHLVQQTLSTLPEGTWELVCHPGYMDSDLQNAGTRLLQSRQVELQALTSEQARQALRQCGIELISYADL